MRVFAFHLLNDYSGSPKVLSQCILAWKDAGYEVHLFVSKSGEGFLSDIPNVHYHYFDYVFYSNRFSRLFALVKSQFQLYWKMTKLIKKEDLVYINTVLPFGAGIGGWLKGNKVVYHIHETSIQPKALKYLLFGIANNTANQLIYVSKYLAETESLRETKKIVLYNALDEKFTALSQKIFPKRLGDVPNILMLSSLKVYKGVLEFLNLAICNPHLNFKLVLNSDQLEIDEFFKGYHLPANLTLYDRQSNVHPFYDWANVLVNLSHIDRWVETFGLTLIEAMAYGIPVIAPPVGGPIEIVSDGFNGYLVDSKNKQKLNQTLKAIIKDTACYTKLSRNALESVKRFSKSEFDKNCVNILDNNHGRTTKRNTS